MVTDESKSPTWFKREPDGTRFVTYDSSLTPVQLQTLDKIVENIELGYDTIVATENSRKNQTISSTCQLSGSYMYKKAQDKHGVFILNNF